MKLSKILLGISAVIAAGIISFIPAKSAQAVVNGVAPSPVTNQVIVSTTFDDRSSDFIIIPGTINWSYSTQDFLVRQTYGQAFVFYNVPEEAIVAASTRLIVEPSGDFSGTAQYSFSYNGFDYSGTLVLQQVSPTQYIGFDYAIPMDPSDPGYEAFFKEINDKVNEIGLAAQGLNADGSENPEKIVNYDCDGAINYKIIKALAQTQGVTLVYTFKYQGYIFTSYITSEDAAKMYNEEIIWYGPCYIANNSKTYLVGEVV